MTMFELLLQKMDQKVLQICLIFNLKSFLNEAVALQEWLYRYPI